MSVKTTHPDYDEYAPMWKRCSDVIDGQASIHKAGEKYLPKLKDEAETDYKARLGRADFFNATWRTVSGLAGMAFRKPPTVTVPSGILPYLDDVNMAGVSLDTMAKSFVEDTIEYGAFGLLVDHPPMPANVGPISVSVAEMLGLRPSIQYYAIESVINWKYTRINNQTVLALVVLKEEASIAEDEFSHKCEDRYRVLDLDEAGQYRQRLYRIDDKGRDEQIGDDIYPLIRGKALSYIPFRIVGEVDEPPLIDLVDANIAHYQVNADYRHGLHFTGLPTAVVSGYAPTETGEKLYIGSRSAWVFPDPQARASYLEFTGQGLTELRAALKELEQRMALLGARMIADETHQVETLGATQIKRSGENSILSNIVNEVSQAVEWALRIFADWAGQSGEVTYEINREFTPVPMDAQRLTSLVSAWQSGALSEAELFDNLKKGDVIAAEKTLDEHQAEIEVSAIPSPSPRGVAA